MMSDVEASAPRLAFTMRLRPRFLQRQASPGDVMSTDGLFPIRRFYAVYLIDSGLCRRVCMLFELHEVSAAIPGVGSDDHSAILRNSMVLVFASSFSLRLSDIRSLVTFLA